MTLRPGETIPAETHRGTTQMFYVEEGAIEIKTWRRGGEQWSGGPGDAFIIWPGVRHRVRALGPGIARFSTVYAFEREYGPPH